MTNGPFSTNNPGSGGRLSLLYLLLTSCFTKLRFMCVSLGQRKPPACPRRCWRQRQRTRATSRSRVIITRPFTYIIYIILVHIRLEICTSDVKGVDV